MVPIIFHRNFRVVVAIVFYIIPFAILVIFIDFIKIRLPNLTLLHRCECPPDYVVSNKSVSDRISKSEIILNGMSLPSPPLETNVSWIRQRLLEADANWKRSNQKRRQKMIKESVIQKINSGTEDLKLDDRLIWDYFYSSFDCPFTVERIGSVGNGGKWVCGFGELQKKSNCLAYTFGLGQESQEFSFEEEILLRTSCIIRIFNPTLTEPPLIVNKYPNRVFFYSVGIHQQNEGKEKTLAALMNTNGDSFIDILKVDIDGSELHPLKAVVKGFPDVPPFGQLQLEVRLQKFPSSLLFLLLRNCWVFLEDAGLRPFHYEPNFLGDSLMLSEIAFLNVNVLPFRFE